MAAAAATTAPTAPLIPPTHPPPPPPLPTPVPPWLESMLRAPFFTLCRAHGMPSPSGPPSSSTRTERNMFCIDCPSAAAFCAYCRAAHHAGHRTVQIRRSSYHDVVRVSDIQAALDVGGVQTYVINSARVVFLNERPQPKGSAGAGAGSNHLAAAAAAGGYTCEVCGRTLLDPFRFCSLGCKLELIRRGGKGSFEPCAEQPDPDNRAGEVNEGQHHTGIAVGGRQGHGSRKRGKQLASASPALSATNRDTAGVAASVGVRGDLSERYGSKAPPLLDSITHLAVNGTTEETTAAETGNVGRNGNRRRKGVPHRAPLST